MAFDWTISGCSSFYCTLRISWCMLRCHIHLRFWHAGLLMIDLIALLSVLILILAWLFWSLHMHTLTTVYHSAWHVDSLTCILFWSSLSMMFVSLFVLIVVFSLILCVHWWYIWALPDCVLHDCPPLAWLHVACLCGSHIYPLISHSLVSVTSFITVLTFASVRPCVCLYSDRDRG